MFLDGFGLGETQFFPLRLNEYDQKTPRPDKLHLYNLAATKDTLIPEESDKAKQPYGEHSQKRNLSGASKRIAVSASALEGADMWIDPKLMDLVFFSDRLVRAMKGKRIGAYAFLECVVVGGLRAHRSPRAFKPLLRFHPHRFSPLQTCDNLGALLL
ncbi:MAG: hypothetical protein AAF360_09340 [Pseudomonadota bacterium]